MAVQIHAGSTSQEYSDHSLTYNMHHGVLCLVRVYALYGRSRPILGLLLFLGLGSIFTSLVGRFLLILRLVYACLNIFLLSIKMSVFLIRKAEGEPIVVLSTFKGCSLYTPHMGYVADSDLCVIRHP